MAQLLPPAPTMTTAEFARWPARKLHELVDGRPVERFGGPAVATLSATVLHVLMDGAQKVRGAVVFPSSLGYDCYRHRPNTIRRPSATVVTRQRLAVVRGDPELMPLPADLAVEVPSPGRGSGGPVLPRVQDHLAAGFPIVWVVRLNDRSVTIHRPDGSFDTLVPGQTLTAPHVLPGFRCDVADLFA